MQTLKMDFQSQSAPPVVPVMVVLLAEDVDRNYSLLYTGLNFGVVLLAEDVDRNGKYQHYFRKCKNVVLLAEDVDRNWQRSYLAKYPAGSSSSRRTWIEMLHLCAA